MRKRMPYKSDIELMKKAFSSTKAASLNLIPPQNPQELQPLIDKIEDKKLREQLTKLINIKN